MVTENGKYYEGAYSDPMAKARAKEVFKTILDLLGADTNQGGAESIESFFKTWIPEYLTDQEIETLQEYRDTVGLIPFKDELIQTMILSTRFAIDSEGNLYRRIKPEIKIKPVWYADIPDGSY